MANLYEVLAELTKVRSHLLLEKDLQAVLSDYLEVASLSAEGLLEIRKSFTDSASVSHHRASDSKERRAADYIQNGDDYNYFVSN